MENEIVETEEETKTELTALPDLAREAEIRTQAMKTILAVIVKVCHKRNIIDMGGNPYITDDGAEKIARVAGVSFTQPVITQYWDEDEEGRRIWNVEAQGSCSVLGQNFYDIGGCTSEDKFIANRRLGTSRMKLEIKKKCMANLRGRLVRGILGLKEFTWDELKSSGFKQDEASKVEYNKGAKTGISDDAKEVREKIRETILHDCEGNSTTAKHCLRLLTTFEGKDGPVEGKENVDKLSDKFANVVWGKVSAKSGKKAEEYAGALERAKDLDFL